MIYYKYKRRSVVLDFRKDIAMELDTNNHSVFMLNYHLIMCVKYRNNVINDAISLRHEHHQHPEGGEQPVQPRGFGKQAPDGGR